MKKLAFATVTIIALLGLLVAGCGTPAPPPEPTTPPPPEEPTPVPEATPIPEPVVGTTYKIGLAPAVTGAVAALGAPEATVGEIIQGQLDEAGGVTGPDGVIHPVEIIMGDTETNPDVAATLARRFIDEDEVVALVMGSCTPISLAIAEVAMEAEVPYISMASSDLITTDPDTGGMRYWVFKSPQGNNHVALWQVERAETLGSTSVCYMHEAGGYGGDCYNNSSGALADAGFADVFEGTFERTDTEFPQVVSIEAAGCDLVIIGAIPPGAAMAHLAIRTALPDIPILHGHGVCTTDFIDIGGADMMEGAEMPCSAVIIAEDVPADDPQKEVFMEFKTAYEEYTGEPVSTFGGHGWDALSWVLEALESLDEGMTLEEQRVAVRDYIETEIVDWPGTAAVFTITPEDHAGMDETSFTWFKVENGAFVPFPAEEW